MTVKNLTLIFVCLLIFSCTNTDEFDAQEAAKQYCDCMKKHKRELDFYAARAVCDGILLQKNKYFRTFHIEAYQGRYMHFLPQTFADSVADFHLQFGNYLENNCCKESLEGCDKNDSFQINRKLLDTLR